MAKQLGYTATSVGFIYLITSIVGLVFRPLLGAISDRFKIQKPMLLCLQVLTIILFVSTLFVPSLPSKAEFQCAEHENVMTVCPPNLNQNDECTIDDIVNNPSEASFGCQMKCTKNDLWSTICGYWNVPGLCESTDNRVVIDTTVVHNRVELEDDCFHLPFNNGSIDNNAAHLHCPVKESVMNCDVKCDDEFVAQVLLGVTDSEARASYQYWMFFTLLVVGYTCMAFIVSVSDAICFGMLDDKPQHYGRQRLWGAIGNSIVGLISGIIIDTVSEGQAVKNYTIAFSIFAGFLLLDVLVISRLKHTQTEVTKTVVKDVAKLFKSVRVVVFFLWCIVLGFAFAMMWGFLFWHLEILGAQQGCGFGNYMKTLQGFVMGVGLLASLPLLIYSGKLIQKIGHIHAMSLVLFMFGLRFFLYSLLKNPWYVLPIELLDGLSVSLFYVCMTSYASLIAPAGTEATLQVS